MFQPRNTLVEVEIIEAAEKKVGSLVIPTNSDLYAEGYIRSIGPGNINAAGARHENHDLHVGQRVLVKRFEVRPHGQGLSKNEAGIRLIIDGKTHILFEQTSILAILAEPIPPTVPGFATVTFPS